MVDLRTLFTSPEWYPLSIDFCRYLVSFVRMSKRTYQDSVFLDHRIRHIGPDVYHLRLDDVLLSAAGVPQEPRRIHYILHPTFCCSTLLARYFELLPHCFVLKEPMLLTQLALAKQNCPPGWNEAFDVSLRLLTRTYELGDLIVIKPHEPSNVLGTELLEHNARATVCFLVTSLRHFLLAVLKSEERRKWIRSRLPAAARAARCHELIGIRPEDVNDAQAAVYLWLVNRFLCEQLASGKHASRVMVLDGDRLAESPEEVLPALMAKCGLHLEAGQLHSLLQHPFIRRYSKDPARPYDAAVRQREIVELEKRWGREADAALDWASHYSQGDTVHTCLLHRGA